MIRASPEGAEGGDDRVYFFFTEVSVEYEFVSKLMIPRVARVCKVRPLPVSLGSTCAHGTSPRPHTPRSVPQRSGGRSLCSGIGAWHL